MPAIAPPPEPVAIMARLEDISYPIQEYAEGREGRLVSSNRQAAYRAWYNRSEYLKRHQEESRDELPAVYQAPIVRTIRTTFYDAGQHQPLPFPDSDD
jgi:hypothetical protein